jgi:two-component system, OmpR family, copper resistance phosphate regulon response regulator CusR
MEAVMRILVVEDEHDAARMLAKGLREHSYAVDIAYDGAEAVSKLYVTSYDLVVLDLMLPDRDGISVCEEIRTQGMAVPVLMLTAVAGVEQRIAGLDCGADDYLTKPFDFGELLARIRALLRRGPALANPILTLSELVIDTRSRSVTRSGRQLDLTAKEYALLEYLVRRRGEVVGRADISEHVWEETYDPCSNLIEVYIQRLRRKLEHNGGPGIIQTRRGEGYQIV